MSDLSNALNRAAGRGANRAAAAPAPARKQLLLRLDPAQHKRLRIMAAERECTMQDLVLQALDSLLLGKRQQG